MKKQTIKYFVCLLALFVFTAVSAQDKIYKTDGTIFEGKVIKVGPNQIQATVPDGPEYTMNQKDVDSIVYANGRHERMGGFVRKKNLLENIPELNTWTFDVLGFTFLSVSQGYERRLKNGKIGFRVPLYVGFIGGGLAGIGTFTPGYGVYYPNSNNSGQGGSGFSIATGLNPKFYLFKRRIIRAFIGPELDFGYTRFSDGGYDYNYNNYYQAKTYYCGTVAMLGSFGLSINPKDKFNMTIHGACGAGNVFGSNNPIGWTGLWQIGFSMGTNW